MSSFLKIGSKAPEFEATAVDGHGVRLSFLLNHGPVVLIFLRGFS